MTVTNARELLKTKVVKVLFLEDQEVDAQSVIRSLKSSKDVEYRVDWLMTVKDALEKLRTGAHDVIISDLKVPDGFGLEIFDALHKVAPQIPILLLTGTLEEETLAIEAIQKGAQDYLFKKNITPDGLIRTLNHAIERKRMEEKLRQANKQLEVLSQLKDEFVANVSHELRTPLTVLKEGTSMMLEEIMGGLNQEQRDFLKIMAESGERLAKLIDNILDIAKIEAGKQRLSRKRTDVRRLIESIINTFRVSSGRRTLRADMTPMPAVFADPDSILQVLTNLVSNAVKFTNEDGTITLALERQDGSVAVSICDDGTGISKDDLPKLFDKFSRVGNAENRPKGTGLGLALCKELIELHKGTVSVTSEIDKGSTFTFTLPVYTPEFALRESFLELVEFAVKNSSGGGTVGTIVIDMQPLVAECPKDERAGLLEHAAKLVQKQVSSQDVVLDAEPYGLVVMAVADANGVQSMAKRLREHQQVWAKTPQGTITTSTLNVGLALYPRDGTEIKSLLAEATKALK